MYLSCHFIRAIFTNCLVIILLSLELYSCLAYLAKVVYYLSVETADGLVRALEASAAGKNYHRAVRT